MTPDRKAVEKNESDRLLYGEPLTDDECLCEVHGSRLGYHYQRGWICDDCDADNEAAEKEAWQIEQDEVEHAFNVWAREQSKGCVVIKGKDFMAFQCTMPWWA